MSKQELGKQLAHCMTRINRALTTGGLGIEDHFEMLIRTLQEAAYDLGESVKNAKEKQDE